MKRKFIEELFPVEEVGTESSKEKSIQAGHISSFHLWWARRPLASSRSTAYAALVYPNKNLEKQTQFIIDLSKWGNSSNYEILKKAKQEILNSNDNNPPKVLDPFSGGGSIPLESLRLGCETYASDYNPVAALLLKCVLEYPQKFTSNSLKDGITSQTKNELIDDIKKWSKFVVDEVKNDIGKYYQSDNDETTPLGYLWSRVVPCQNPKCGAKIPLFPKFWISKKTDKPIAAFPFVQENEITIKIVGKGYEKIPKGFDPEKGNVSRGKITCLKCNSIMDQETTRKLFVAKKTENKMMIVITYSKGIGKKYRVASKKDFELVNKASKLLEKKKLSLKKEWGIEPIPDEPIKRVPFSFGVINVWVYGINTWGDLFESRQKLAIITYIEKIRNSYKKMIDSGYDSDYAKIIVTYLAIAADKLPVFSSYAAKWQSTAEKIANAFGTNTIPMSWSFPETNPTIYTAGSFETAIQTILRVMKNLSLPKGKVSVKLNSATSLPYDDEFFDAILTDPPYYDNVPYSYLSDFFYVWLKRSVGFLYPELFSTPLTPKANEVVAYNDRNEFESAKAFFENSMSKALQEIYRVLKFEGIAVIVYAHKSTEGWETMINSLLKSGLIITGSWPIYTERKTRIRGQEAATLTSSIYIIARKGNKESVGFYREIKSDLKKYLNKKLDFLWSQRITGADFFISAIGLAMEVFGKYEKVVNDSDDKISTKKFLDDVREIVTNYAIRKVLHHEFSEEISHMTRFYILWRWAFGESSIPFDDANKLAHSVGVDLEHEWNKGFIVKEKSNIRIIGPDKRKIDDLENAHELIDILHYVLILWKNNSREKLSALLKEKGLGNNDIFKRIGQAISESLPQESIEKKWLDGFLTGFKSEDSQGTNQSKLF
jgi:putative DNA methylase